MNTSAESLRLTSTQQDLIPWKLWGPYLSDRQWGTVREDYSPQGDAWSHLSHDHARSRAYRWGEDGLAGMSDDQARLCLALALWNGRDPILKERLFGLTNAEGNHGEDVKELYYHLDATPTHSWMHWRYLYPQAEFPYRWLVEENARRRSDRSLPEFELIDTGILEGGYWDVDVQYAKGGPEDLLMNVTAHNRGRDTATLHLLPQLWFRNTWSWRAEMPRPVLRELDDGSVRSEHPDLGAYRLECDGGGEWLFTENETNTPRLFGCGGPGWFKDAFHEAVVHGRREALKPDRCGTKTAAHRILTVAGGASAVLRVRLTRILADARLRDAFQDFDLIFERRRWEADEFFGELQSGMSDPDARQVQRQALAGMMWSKQFFHYDVADWLSGDPAQIAPPAERRNGRNCDWVHLNNADILSMPDKWEYPWFAAWDLAFHCLPLALVDAEFAKEQLVLLTREWYMHPNGQLPAYEWNFSDVNPPVHGWAAWRVFQIDRKQRRRTAPQDPGDIAFLERVFHKLLLNFTWWVNRKDAQGRNIFQGGFLGLDNIGCFDRSAPLPTGGFINQADGTSWMAMYSLNLMRIALELARHNRTYEDIATKFFEHFLHIAAAINGVGEGTLGLWDEDDGFYYDHLCLPDGTGLPLKVRSLVGLIPILAVETLETSLLESLPGFRERMEWFLEHRPGLATLVSRWNRPGMGGRHLLSLLRGHRLKCLLRRMLDPGEFLSDYGIRSVSRFHEAHPYRFDAGGLGHEVPYWPAESQNGLFGGNSNWRGPVWMPLNYLLIEALQKFHHYHGEAFQVESPTGSGRFLTLNGVADEVSRRLCSLFLAGPDGRRPCLGSDPRFSGDPQFRDRLQFHEYFHGDTGCGLGASHQTGWTGLVAKLLQPRGSQARDRGGAAFVRPRGKGSRSGRRSSRSPVVGPAS